mmetsp:Transcript_60186/g.99858  ORF Transcript_60186/g.99858 Transcript_60186/m.99858 type:complete len:310 (+) Transcript_60186:122-1051(+)
MPRAPSGFGRSVKGSASRSSSFPKSPSSLARTWRAAARCQCQSTLHGLPSSALTSNGRKCCVMWWRGSCSTRCCWSARSSSCSASRTSRPSGGSTPTATCSLAGTTSGLQQERAPPSRRVCTRSCALRLESSVRGSTSAWRTQFWRRETSCRGSHSALPITMSCAMGTPSAQLCRTCCSWWLRQTLAKKAASLHPLTKVSRSARRAPSFVTMPHTRVTFPCSRGTRCGCCSRARTAGGRESCEVHAGVFRETTCWWWRKMKTRQRLAACHRQWRRWKASSQVSMCRSRSRSKSRRKNNRKNSRLSRSRT